MEIEKDILMELKCRDKLYHLYTRYSSKPGTPVYQVHLYTRYSSKPGTPVYQVLQCTCPARVLSMGTN